MENYNLKTLQSSCVALATPNIQSKTTFHIWFLVKILIRATLIQAWSDLIMKCSLHLISSKCKSLVLAPKYCQFHAQISTLVRCRDESFAPTAYIIEEDFNERISLLTQRQKNSTSFEDYLAFSRSVQEVKPNAQKLNQHKDLFGSRCSFLWKPRNCSFKPFFKGYFLLPP